MGGGNPGLRGSRPGQSAASGCNLVRRLFHIRLWKTLAQDFPEYKVLNRGFGGCQIADCTYYADRIVVPYKPRLIVLRAGGNDIAAGKTSEQV